MVQITYYPFNCFVFRFLFSFPWWMPKTFGSLSLPFLLFFIFLASYLTCFLFVKLYFYFWKKLYHVFPKVIFDLKYLLFTIRFVHVSLRKGSIELYFGLFTFYCNQPTLSIYNGVVLKCYQNVDNVHSTCNSRLHCFIQCAIQLPAGHSWGETFRIIKLCYVQLNMKIYVTSFLNLLGYLYIVECSLMYIWY